MKKVLRKFGWGLVGVAIFVVLFFAVLAVADKFDAWFVVIVLIVTAFVSAFITRRLSGAI